MGMKLLFVMRLLTHLLLSRMRSLMLAGRCCWGLMVKSSSNISLVKYKEGASHALSITLCAGFPCFSRSFQFGLPCLCILEPIPCCSQWLHNQLMAELHGQQLPPKKVPKQAREKLPKELSLHLYTNLRCVRRHQHGSAIVIP